MRLALVLLAVVAVVTTIVIRSRRSPEVWHVAVDVPQIGASEPIGGRT